MGRMEELGGREELLAMWDSTCICEELLCFIFARHDSDEANSVADGGVDGDECTKLTGRNAADILLLMDYNTIILPLE